METYIVWKPPQFGWFKLNINCSSHGNPSLAGVRGIICDHHGRFISAYHVHVGRCSAFKAECWALKLGLEVAWTIGYRRLIVKMDSQSLYLLIQGESLAFGANAALLKLK